MTHPSPGPWSGDTAISPLPSASASPSVSRRGFLGAVGAVAATAFFKPGVLADDFIAPIPPPCAPHTATTLAQLNVALKRIYSPEVFRALAEAEWSKPWEFD